MTAVNDVCRGVWRSWRWRKRIGVALQRRHRGRGNKRKRSGMAASLTTWRHLSSQHGVSNNIIMRNGGVWLAISIGVCVNGVM